MNKVKPMFRNEKHFQGSIVSAARQLGWRAYHTYDSRRSAPGFPDLVLVRGRRIVYAELKSERGVMSAAQYQWLRDLVCAGQDVFLWRPSDWDAILAELQIR